MQLYFIIFVAMSIIRRTKSVNDITQFFEESKYAVSVVNLVERFKEKMNKTTVYRILDKLENDGVIHSFIGRDSLKWYAKCQGCQSGHHTDTHPHFQCNSCGRVECLPVKLQLPEIQNLSIEYAEVNLVGKCTECSN